MLGLPHERNTETADAALNNLAKCANKLYLANKSVFEYYT